MTSEEQERVGSLRIGNNLIEWWDNTMTIRTTFPDGCILIAAPQFDDTYKGTAESLGYGSDLWQMCKDHEILHTRLAVEKGKEYSRGLYRAAMGLDPDYEDYLEEAEVMNKQRRI